MPLPKLRSPSFRTKLIVAMTLVVAGVTGATLYVASKRVQTTYQHQFEQQFQQQLAYFSEVRLRQLNDLVRKCEALGKSVRLASALETAIEDNDPDFVYDNLSTEIEVLAKATETTNPALTKLRENMRREQPARSNAQRDRERDRFQSNLFNLALVDAEGRILVPDKKRATFMFKPDLKNRTEVFSIFKEHAASEVLKEQEIGYLPMRKETDNAQLREVILTPIINQGSGETIGALIMGFPVRDFGESAMYQFSEKALQSGIWLGGRVYSKTIPDDVHESVSSRIKDVLQHSDLSSKDVISIEGVPHRLIYKVLNPESLFPPAVQVGLYSMSEALAEQMDLRSKALGFGVVALLIGVGFIFLISHGFSKPIEQLVEGTRRIQEGDYTVKVPVTTRDEIGTLAKSFNEMAEELALKERYKSVLAQVTDKQVAEELINGRLPLGGEVRQVSVLFCDIRGFTALTENMPPSEVIAMLNEHMSAMNRIVYQHYGVVDKFVGDLIMAVFGAPKSYGNDALHAVKCAVRMMEERVRLNTTSQYKFDVGIGVATGEVVAGLMGSDDRQNYTVLGERVNLASRLCSKASSAELLIDDTTYAQLPEGFTVQATEPLPLKGFSLPMAAYRLISMSEEVGAPPTGLSTAKLHH
ncbi:adenylate/guanylate cyclase domain-containing protein [Roseimicrobium sp. ORNL1]|uniref:adenylate/guanylate cyclase domain-containing protein n=1 Tax=Roseimicrobium sp. ORNL1 TaxID=2711231 RepID=UPI0013E17EA0|nr:adenylate/guanylate cyclase domain-containing protein [Roseimicrobium sp. ORNL1]QIF03407.1 HAMP domain-containing protein [Roseimicrobium sp. ORNL1]